MDNLVKLIDALAWPVAILMLAFGFRTEFRKILGRMSKFKYKDVEATFEHELAQIETRSELYSESQKELPASTPAEKSGYAQLLRIAEVSPRAAITEAWREMELAVGQIAESMGMNSSNPFNGLMALRSLVQQDRIDSSLLEDYNRLRKLRNHAAHADELEISQTEAERYAALAIEMAGFLKKFVKKAR